MGEMSEQSIGLEDRTGFERPNPHVLTFTRGVDASDAELLRLLDEAEEAGDLESVAAVRSIFRARAEAAVRAFHPTCWDVDDVARYYGGAR